MKLSSSLTGGICSFFNVTKDWNCILFVFDFILSVWHLSTRIIRSTHVDHLRNALRKSWLSRSKAVAIAVLPANWNQCFGYKASLYT